MSVREWIALVLFAVGAVVFGWLTAYRHTAWVLPYSVSAMLAVYLIGEAYGRKGR
jgi:hypothetical protein